MRRWTLYVDLHGDVVPESRSDTTAITVMPVEEHEQRLAEAQAWADDVEHPNWEAGWHAGKDRSGPVTAAMVERGARAAWDAMVARAADQIPSYTITPWGDLDDEPRMTWLQDTRAALEAVIGRPR